MLFTRELGWLLNHMSYICRVFFFFFCFCPVYMTLSNHLIHNLACPFGVDASILLFDVLIPVYFHLYF